MPIMVAHIWMVSNAVPLASILLQNNFCARSKETLIYYLTLCNLSSLALGQVPRNVLPSTVMLMYNMSTSILHLCMFASWMVLANRLLMQFQWHYIDVIMRQMASQITRLTIVYLTVYSGADQRKYQSAPSLAFVTYDFPAQRASNAENVSIWWRHHGILRIVQEITGKFLGSTCTYRAHNCGVNHIVSMIYGIMPMKPLKLSRLLSERCLTIWKIVCLITIREFWCLVQDNLSLNIFNQH